MKWLMLFIIRRLLKKYYPDYELVRKAKDVEEVAGDETEEGYNY